MMTEDDLDSLFSAARATAPEPSAALTARVLADAAAAMPAASAFTPAAPPARAGLVQRLLGAFGGAGALAGMATAAVAGLYIGFAQPMGEGVFALVTGVSDGTTLDMMPGIDALLDEAP